MPWRRNDPDPLEEMRRKLAEQERQLSEQMSRLNEQLHPSGEKSQSTRQVEPPVWRLEEDGSARRSTTPTRGPKRHLARQIQRDMWLFFIALGVLIMVMMIFVWVAYARNNPQTIGP